MSDSNPSLWFTGPRTVEIRDIPKPIPAAGEVLIRTRRTLISTGTELSLFKGDEARPGSMWSKLASYPLPCGYSNAGQIVDVGEGVDRGLIGKRAASRARHAAWVSWRLSDVRLIPDNVAEEEAAFSTLAAVTMNGFRRAGLTWGESVAVFGLGILGHLAVQIAAASGAGPIFAVELEQLRRNKLRPQPLVHLLDGQDPGQWLEAVKGHNHGRAVDMVVETTAAADLIPAEMELLRDHGRMLIVSSPRGNTSFDFHDHCNRRSLSIFGAHGFSQPRHPHPDNPWTSQRHGEVFLEWLGIKRMNVGDLITHRFSFERAAEAYGLLAERRGDALAVIFEWA